jgi:hypothetical protein
MQTETKQKMVLGSLNFLNTLKGLPPTIISSLRSWILDETILSLMSVETTQKIASIETTTIYLQTDDVDISIVEDRETSTTESSFKNGQSDLTEISVDSNERNVHSKTYKSNPNNNNITVTTTPLTGK